MKHLWLLFALTMMTAFSADAQRTAYVNVAEILEKMPEYKEAQTKLDQTAERWKQDIAQDYAKIDEMYRRYQAEEPLLSDDERKRRQDEIVKKESDVRKMQKDKFGPEGSLFKKRQELVKPIQDKVYNAIQDYATKRGFDVIMDSSNGASILFLNPTLDKTADILKRLGK